jgi:hypothetical protein
LGDKDKRKNYDLYGETEDFDDNSFSEFMKNFSEQDFFDFLFNENDINDLQVRNIK